MGLAHLVKIPLSLFSAALNLTRFWFRTMSLTEALRLNYAIAAFHPAVPPFMFQKHCIVRCYRSACYCTWVDGPADRSSRCLVTARTSDDTGRHGSFLFDLLTDTFKVLESDCVVDANHY